MRRFIHYLLVLLSHTSLSFIITKYYLSAALLHSVHDDCAAGADVYHRDRFVNSSSTAVCQHLMPPLLSAGISHLACAVLPLVFVLSLMIFVPQKYYNFILRWEGVLAMNFVYNIYSSINFLSSYKSLITYMLKTAIC